MNASLRFRPIVLSERCDELRAEVRGFLAEERREGALPAVPTHVGMEYSQEFSRRLGQRGWIGWRWPREYGGHEGTALERYVLTEELLAAGAPVRAHWVADRQSGPVLLAFGSEAQRRAYLPRIAAGECYFCIGLSEPDSGSDLASLRTRAERVEGGGFRINGTKLWTSNAHRVHYMLALFRTASATAEQRRGGLSQFIVDLSLPGITVRPVRNLAGEHDFNEVHFEDVMLPEDCLVGTLHEGWRQVSAELAYERSGPERWLSTYHLLARLAETLGPDATSEVQAEIGELMVDLVTLRRMSLSVAGMLEAGEEPNVQAALVKEIGTRFEQRIPRIAHRLCAGRADHESRDSTLRQLLEHALMWSPAFTIRGGSTEILRGIIARGLGLR
jgi:alkylation response protein AidB-like acyl-CoA dehydrogenase